MRYRYTYTYVCRYSLKKTRITGKKDCVFENKCSSSYCKVVTCAGLVQVTRAGVT